MRIDYAALKRKLAGRRGPVCPRPDGFVADSVCLLLVDRPETAVVAIQKTDSEGYHWRAQVALPGGRIDPGDKDACAAALRELHEELGIEPGAVELLGSLGHFQTVSSNHDLDVVVGRWSGPAPLRIDAREIARVIEVPLDELIETHAADFAGRSIADIGAQLGYAVDGARIWGVTARILHEFLEEVSAFD